MPRRLKPLKPTKSARRNNKVYGSKLTAEKLAEACGLDAKTVADSRKLLRTADGLIDGLGSWIKYASLEEARQHREEIDSNIRMLRYRKLRNELMSVILLTEHWNKEWHRMLEAFQALPERLAPELAALTDIRMVRARLHEAYTQTMWTLRDTWVPPEAPPDAVYYPRESETDRRESTAPQA